MTTLSSKSLAIPARQLAAVNSLLFDPEQPLVRDFLQVVARYGTPEEINRQAAAARDPNALHERVATLRPEYLPDLDWLAEQCQRNAFISIAEYRRRVLGERAAHVHFREDSAVTLEISSCQYFPWLMQIAHRACDEGLLMPGRFIFVRNMKEQEADGDLAALSLAMHIIGASYVEQPDTRGVDGSNNHLGGPDTIIGYYGGVGQPNEHPLTWLDEVLYYYTKYGIGEVLNLNAGTVLLGFLLYRLGVDVKFKISVTMGHDNPYSALWTLSMAKLFARADGSVPLAGLNWSNSVTVDTIKAAAGVRRELGLEQWVRFEHHVTETWKGIVIQPYDRRQDIVELAACVPNMSAKHEGGDPEVEQRRQRPSDIRDYYRSKAEIVASGEWEHLTLNFHDKFDALNHTASALTERGLAFVAAANLHR